MQVIELFKEFSSNDNNIFLIGVKATLAYEKMTKKIKNVSIFTKTLLDYEEWITEKFPKVKDEKKFLALAALVELQEITKTNEKIYDNFREFFKK